MQMTHPDKIKICENSRETQRCVLLQKANLLGSSKSLWSNTGAFRRDVQEEHSSDQHRGCFCNTAGVPEGEKQSQLKCSKEIQLLCASPEGVQGNEDGQRESGAEKE